LGEFETGYAVEETSVDVCAADVEKLRGPHRLTCGHDQLEGDASCLASFSGEERRVAI
jgi:hypothetical protein